MWGWEPVIEELKLGVDFRQDLHEVSGFAEIGEIKVIASEQTVVSLQTIFKNIGERIKRSTEEVSQLEESEQCYSQHFIHNHTGYEIELLNS